jgi:GTPase-associated protein 1, N-terminal domain type 2
MEQLWYTWSSVGIPRIKGYQVRAASEGLADLQSKRFKDIDPHLRYYLPTGTDLYEATPEGSPTTLAFIRTDDEYIAVQKVYIGTDAGGRPGNYFCHLLASLPNFFTACDVIELWKSPIWKVSATSLPEASLMLPQVRKEELIKGSLNYANMLEVQEYLPFAIQAFLLLKFDQKLYIYAPDGIVATLIWGLAHSIPCSMQRRLTFSTYEQNVDKDNVDKADIRVVGSCRAYTPSSEQDGYTYTTRQQDLPGDCYNGGRGFALNFYTGKRSQLPQGTPEAVFAQFATQCLVNEYERSNLINMLVETTRINFDDAGSFLVFFKLYTADEKQPSLTEEEINDLLGNYDLAAVLLKREGVQLAVIDLMLKNPQWWEQYGIGAFQKLGNPSNAVYGESAADALVSLAKRTVVEACEGAFHHNVPLFQNMLYLLVAVAPLDKNPEVWVDLQLGLTAPYFTKPSFHLTRIISWEWRLWLLVRWGSVSSHIPNNYIQPWLKVSWDELEALLTEELPSSWYVIAITDLLKDTSLLIPHLVVPLVANHNQLFRSALGQLMQDASTQSVAISFFKKLVEYGYQGKIQMLFFLLSYPIQDWSDFENLLRSTNLTPVEKMDLFERWYQLLLRYLVPSATVQSMVELYMHNFTLDRLVDSKSRELLMILESHRQQFPERLDQVAYRVNAWNLVSDGYPPPQSEMHLDINKKHLEEVCDAIYYLHLETQPEYKNRLFLVIINTVKKQDELRSVVESFASVLTTSKSREDLLFELGAFIGSRYRGVDSRNPDLWKTLLPYITLTLTYALKLQKSVKEKFLDKVLPALLTNVDGETFDKIDQAAESWPQEIREEWEIHVNTLRPKNPVEKAIATGVWIGRIGKRLWPKSPLEVPIPQGSGTPAGSSPKTSQGESNTQGPGEPPVQPTQSSRLDPAPGVYSTEAQPVSPDSPMLATESSSKLIGKYPAREGESLTTSTAYPISSTIVAIVNRQNITFEQLERYYIIKEIYFQYRIDRLQADLSKEEADQEKILKERDWLSDYLHLDRQLKSEAVRDELVEDVLIRQWLSVNPSWDNIVNEELKNHLAEISKDFKSFVKSKSRGLLKRINEKEINGIVSIYIRRVLIKRHLKNQQIEVRPFLEDLRTKTPPVVNKLPIVDDRLPGSL